VCYRWAEAHGDRGAFRLRGRSTSIAPTSTPLARARAGPRANLAAEPSCRGRWVRDHTARGPGRANALAAVVLMQRPGSPAFPCASGANLCKPPDGSADRAGDHCRPPRHQRYQRRAPGGVPGAGSSPSRARTRELMAYATNLGANDDQGRGHPAVRRHTVRPAEHGDLQRPGLPRAAASGRTAPRRCPAGADSRGSAERHPGRGRGQVSPSAEGGAAPLSKPARRTGRAGAGRQPVPDAGASAQEAPDAPQTQRRDWT
jgi:hypothetical protein